MFQKKLDAHLEKLKEWDALNHLLGRYISYAFNQPKKYPGKPFLDGEEKLKDMSDEEMERVMKANNKMLGGKVNDNN